MALAPGVNNQQNGPNLEQLLGQVAQALTDPGNQMNEPSWRPSTMFSWHFETGTHVKPGVRGQPADPHIWIIKKNFPSGSSNGDNYTSLIGDRTLTSGIYYWEWKFLDINGGRIGFGITSPPGGSNDNSISTEWKTGLWYYGGSQESKILGSYACAWWIPPDGSIYREIWSGDRGNSILQNKIVTNDRLGLLLDLVKGELKLYHFKAGNITRDPDQEVTLVTSLIRGRGYMPFFTLCSTNTQLELVIDEEVPTGIRDYKNRIMELVSLLDQSNQQLRTLQELALNEREQHINNYRRLMEYIQMLRQRLGMV